MIYKKKKEGINPSFHNYPTNFNLLAELNLVAVAKVLHL